MHSLKFGFADTVITPENPTHVFLDGYGFRMKPAEGIRDDLHAKVMAIVDGDKVFLLFSLDLIGLRKTSYELISAQITALTGVPRSQMALTAIHTHAAPATGLIDELPIHTDYLAYVGECCGRAALRAIERSTPGSFEFALLPETLHSSYNRRGRDVIDRSIRAAAFRDTDGVLCGVLCSASCHAVINTDYTISADYLSVLNSRSSDDLPYLFLQGRGADVDPKFEGTLTIDEKIEQLGRELADPVCRMAEQSTCHAPAVGVPFVQYELVRIPMKPLRDASGLEAEIKAAEERYFAYPPTDIKKHHALRQLQWLRHMLRLVKANETNDITVPLQYLEIPGLCAFAFLPFEVLTLTGDKLEALLMRKGFPKEAVYICGYSNDVEGYLAPEEEFPFGGYEVSRASHWSNISETLPESEKALLDWFWKTVHEAL